MVNLKLFIRHRVLSILMTCSLIFLPINPFLSLASADSTCSAPSQSTSFHYPNGADSATFTYNCSTGLWENAHFTYDPSTGKRTQIDPIVYRCDPSSRAYNYTTWAYSPSRGDFYSSIQSVNQPPAGSVFVACPTPLPTPNAPIGVNSGVVSPTAVANNQSGSASTNTTNNSLNNNANIGNNNTLNIGNSLSSNAHSGDALAFGNTIAGNVSTGDAVVVANEINMLQSSNNFGLNGQPTTFVANINGNVNGNFLLDPATIASVQPTSSNTTNNSINNNLTINNTNNATLTNNLDLNAGTGNASAQSNTNAGNVSTGNAKAVADIVNTINSSIAAGHSFLGVININGNLNGNILLPPDFVNQLIADNVPTVNVTGPGSVNSSNTNINNTENVTNTNNQGINNNIKLAASSGNASVDKNTSSGNANTGNASTNVTAFNLTGSKVVGSNDLLVFVNVLGKWVGLIVNAPPGANAAELGGGITSSGPNSSNTSNNNVNDTANVNNNTKQQINNNINVNANSGNANANKNTNVGNVTSGDASAAVNLLNIENSNLALSNWFGILFINVFGTWNGNFGIDNPTIIPSNNDFSSSTNSITNSANNDIPVPIPLRTFAFIPTNGGQNNDTFNSNNVHNGSALNDKNAILADAQSKTNISKHSKIMPTNHHNFYKTAALINGGLVFAYLSAESILSRRKIT